MTDHLDGLWDWSDASGSEQRFRDAAGSLQGEAKVEAITQVARALGRQGRFDEAHDTLDGIESQLQGAGPAVLARFLLERGRLFNSANRPNEARPLFFKACEVAEQAGEEVLAIDALHMMGIVEPLDTQLDWTLRAVAVAESSDKPQAKRWLASLYNNAGWTLHDRGDHAQALEIFERALDLRLNLNQAPEARIARWAVARCLRSLGRLEEALERQRSLLAEHERAGTSDGFVDEEIGECLQSLGRPEEARPWFASAHEALSKDAWLASHEPDRLARLKTLSE